MWDKKVCCGLSSSWGWFRNQRNFQHFYRANKSTSSSQNTPTSTRLQTYNIWWRLRFAVSPSMKPMNMWIVESVDSYLTLRRMKNLPRFIPTKSRITAKRSIHIYQTARCRLLSNSKRKNRNPLGMRSFTSKPRKSWTRFAGRKSILNCSQKPTRKTDCFQSNLPETSNR